MKGPKKEVLQKLKIPPAMGIHLTSRKDRKDTVMSKKNNPAPVIATGQNRTNNMPSTKDQFNLKETMYEDVKQVARDFEVKHPGATRKLTCATVIGIAGTAIIDAVIILAT